MMLFGSTYLFFKLDIKGSLSPPRNTDASSTLHTQLSTHTTTMSFQLQICCISILFDLYTSTWPKTNPFHFIYWPWSVLSSRFVLFSDHDSGTLSSGDNRCPSSLKVFGWSSLKADSNQLVRLMKMAQLRRMYPKGAHWQKGYPRHDDWASGWAQPSPPLHGLHVTTRHNPSLCPNPLHQTYMSTLRRPLLRRPSRIQTDMLEGQWGRWPSIHRSNHSFIWDQVELPRSRDTERTEDQSYGGRAFG